MVCFENWPGVEKRRNTYFISDLHLGARYVADRRAQEKRVVSFLRSIAGDAKALYMLGDVLDYWYEYRYVVPRGYVRFFGELARLADAGVKIYWFIGNHDIWLFDYLRDEIGISIVDPAGGGIESEIHGSVFFLGHGDGVGRQPRAFRCLRYLFRNKFCQRLYAGIHPRWTVGFAMNWSRSSRSSHEGKAERLPDSIRVFASTYTAAHPEVHYIIMGHYHLQVDEVVGKHCRLIVLGDWIDGGSYAVFDGMNLEICKYKG